MDQVMSNVKVEHLTIAVEFQGNLLKGHHSATGSTWSLRLRRVSIFV